MTDRDDLADIAAIVDTAIRYTWALDTKQLDDLRTVFTPDATADLRGADCVGVEAIIERIGSALSRLDRTQHLVGNHQVVVDGDTATHRCQLQAQHVRDGGHRATNFVIGGHYVDEFVRTADGWRIHHRTLHETWNEGISR